MTTVTYQLSADYEVEVLVDDKVIGVFTNTPAILRALKNVEAHNYFVTVRLQGYPRQRMVAGMAVMKLKKVGKILQKVEENS